MCEHRYSKGSRWRAGCKISTICPTKRPGSKRAKNEERCYARYNKTDFLEHLANRANCIYHKLVLEFEALESCLNKAYGDKIILYFKKSNIPYAHMFHFSLARGSPRSEDSKKPLTNTNNYYKSRKRSQEPSGRWSYSI